MGIELIYGVGLLKGQTRVATILYSIFGWYCLLLVLYWDCYHGYLVMDMLLHANRHLGLIMGICSVQ